MRDIEDEIRKNFDEAEFEQTVQKYLQVYRGALTGDDIEEKVKIELVADAYAGMNRFRDTNTAQYRETVQRMLDAVESFPQTNENAAALARRGVGDDGKTKLSFAGERAKTANVQALRDAQEMETIGADMESIRKATGWHKGRDGKWRFEIDDSGMRFERSGERRGIDRSTAMREYNRSWNVLTGREMTEQQRSNLRRYVNEANSDSFDETLYRRLSDEFGSAFEDFAAALEAKKESRDYSVGKVLADYLSHDALFAAYPELRNAGITFERLEEGTHGYYSAKENEIHLSNKLKNAPESTLIHEIQHIIQQIEGFSGGSSPEYWARKDYENGTSVSERLQKRYDDLLNGLSREDQNRYIRYTELERELGRLFLAEESSEDGRKYARLEAEQDKLYEELWQNEWFRKLLDLDRKIGNPSEEYYRLYRNTAGEIEARDSENRRGLTAEQRKETAPDYGNEDTVLVESGGSYSIVEPFIDRNGKQYENAVLLDTDFFDGISPRNWGQKLRQYVESRAEASPFIMTVQDENGNSQAVQFAGKRDRVKKGGNVHPVLSELYETSDNISKLAVIHIDEIAEISEESNPYYTGESTHGWLDEHGWLHRNANVVNARNGAIYNLTFDIAKTRDGRTILYATKGKIKKVGDAQVHSLKIRGAEQNSNFDGSIHRNAEKSQEGGVKFSLANESDGEYLSLAEKYRDGTASEEETKRLQEMVDAAAEAALEDSEARIEPWNRWDGGGKLVKVYHTTNEQFTVFDRKKLGGMTDNNASTPLLAATAHVGHWFNTSATKVKERTRTKHTIAAYLDIKRPYVAGTVEGLANDIAEYTDAEPGEDWDYEGYTPKRIAKRFIDHLEWNGYDGVVVSKDEEFGGTSFVVLNSDQIKSADPVTYDNEGQIIPLSERCKGAVLTDCREKTILRVYLSLPATLCEPGVICLAETSGAAPDAERTGQNINHWEDISLKKLLCIVLLLSLLSGCALVPAEAPTAEPTREVSEPTAAPTLAPTHTVFDERRAVEGCENAWYVSLPALEEMPVPEFLLADDALFAYCNGYSETGDGNFLLRRISLTDGSLAGEYVLPSGYVNVQFGETAIGLCDTANRTVHLLDLMLNETGSYAIPEADFYCLSTDLQSVYTVRQESGVERVELATGETTPVISNAADVYLHDQTQTAVAVSYMDRATQRNTCRMLDLRSGTAEELPIAGGMYQATRVQDTWLLECAVTPGAYTVVNEGDVFHTGQKYGRFELLAPRAELLDFDLEGVGMTLYHADGGFLSRCVLPEALYVGRSIVWSEAWNGYLMLAVTDTGECGTVLWDPSVPTNGEPLATEAELPDVGTSTDPVLYERAAQIGETFGLDLRIADRCKMGYDDYDAAEFSDGERLSLALDILEAALSDYPTGYFRQLLYGNVQSIRVELIGSLVPKADAELGETAAAFAQELAGEYLVVFDVYTLSAGNVYHEFTHVTDRRLAWDAAHREGALFSEEVWSALNPTGFAYAESYEDYPAELWQYNNSGCFVSEYSMTFPTEDRATMMEMAMTGDLLAQDYWAPLREKLQYYSECIRDCFDTENWQEPLPWEAVLC